MSISRFIIIIACSLFVSNCSADSAKENMLFDFKSYSELDQLHWKCHTLYSLSKEHPTHGCRSLKMELYPSDYPGLAPMLKENDWSEYNKLCLDIYNPQDKVQIFIRIDDQKTYPYYEDRYNRGFILESGMNRISMPLDTLITSGTKRNLDLKKICRLSIFMENPRKRVVLYVDNIRLVRQECALTYANRPKMFNGFSVD